MHPDPLGQATHGSNQHLGALSLVSTMTAAWGLTGEYINSIGAPTSGNLFIFNYKIPAGGAL